MTVLGMTSWLFGNHWESSDLEGAMRAPLHMLEILLCSVHRSSSGRTRFLGSPPLSLSALFYILIHYLPSRFSRVLPVQGDEAGVCSRVVLAGGAHGWVASRAGS